MGRLDDGLDVLRVGPGFVVEDDGELVHLHRCLNRSSDCRPHGLRLNLAMPNRAVTPEALRSEIEAFVDTVVSTQKLWGDR